MTVRGASNEKGPHDGRIGPMVGIGPRRQAILDLLEHNPGLNLDEVAAALGVRRTAAKHHLRLLERDGLVVRVQQGRHVLHFRHGLPVVDQEIFRLFRVPSVRRVAEALYFDPACRREDLAATLDVTPRTIRRAIRHLSRAGLARSEEGPQGPLVLLHPRLRMLVARGAAPPPAPSRPGDAS
ncbi:MAG: helix-turn-helix domain-containing protein [Thermoplasmatota archaeon]